MSSIYKAVHPVCTTGCNRMSSAYLSRRRALQALAVSMGGVLSGCSVFQDERHSPTSHPIGPTSENPEVRTRTRPLPSQLEEQYETIVNVVDAGADNTGRRPINNILEAEYGDDTLLYFPSGEYVLDDIFDIERLSNLALIGDGAKIRPPQGYTGYLFSLGSRSGARDLWVEGIDFDFTAPNTGARPIHATVEDGLLVRDVAVYGRQDVNYDCMRFDITTETGSGHVERLRLPDGGNAKYMNTGIYVGQKSVGTLSFVDCEVAGWPDNGLYASPARGPVHVLGGHYENNGIAGVRVSGDSRVRNVTVRCDSTRSGLENMRGIRLRAGRDIVVENVRVEMQAVTESDGAIVMAEWFEDGVVKNSVIRTDADRVPALLAKRPTPKVANTLSQSGSRNINVGNVRVTGRAAQEAAINISNRDNCVLQDICITQRGPRRNGIRVSDSTGNILQNTAVDVTGDPLVLNNATARCKQFWTQNVAKGCK